MLTPQAINVGDCRNQQKEITGFTHETLLRGTNITKQRG